VVLWDAGFGGADVWGFSLLEGEVFFFFWSDCGVGEKRTSWVLRIGWMDGTYNPSLRAPGRGV